MKLKRLAVCAVATLMLGTGIASQVSAFNLGSFFRWSCKSRWNRVFSR